MIKFLLFTPLSIITILFILVINIFFKVRFFIANTSRIGTLSDFTLYYKNFLKSDDKKYFDILLPPPKVKSQFANNFLEKKIIQMDIKIINFFFNTNLIYYIKKFLSNKSNFFTYSIYNQSKFLQKKEIVFFDKNEIVSGRDFLKKQGLKENDKIICVHNRDKKYLKTVQPNINWDYHDYRDFSISSMLPAIEYFLDKGYYVFRMGKITEEKLNLKHKKFLDYGNSDLRSDFNDIYLLSECHIYFGSDSGIYSTTDHFKKKVSFINFPSINLLGRYHSDKISPTITKLLIDKEKNKLLSIKEILQINYDVSLKINDLEKKNLEIVNNKSKDILNLAKEINGEYKIDDKEIEFIKNKFNKIYNEFHQNKNYKHSVPNISISFLKENNFLLD